MTIVTVKINIRLSLRNPENHRNRISIMAMPCVSKLQGSIECTKLGEQWTAKPGPNPFSGEALAVAWQSTRAISRDLLGTWHLGTLGCTRCTWGLWLQEHFGGTSCNAPELSSETSIWASSEANIAVQHMCSLCCGISLLNYTKLIFAYFDRGSVAHM